jgi:hypothetical protein
MYAHFDFETPIDSSLVHKLNSQLNIVIYTIIIQFMTKHTLVLMQPKEPTNINTFKDAFRQEHSISINH